MKNIDIEIEYLQRLRDGSTVEELNENILRDGEPINTRVRRPNFSDDDFIYTWKPKYVTITIPEPMGKHPELKQDYYYRVVDDPNGYYCTRWLDDHIDHYRFSTGIWATEEEMKQVIAADRAAVVAARREK